MQNIYNTLKTKSTIVIVYSLALLLATIPLPSIYSSFSVILFLLISFSGIYKLSFHKNKTLFLPIALYIVMLFSLLWTQDFELSIKGLQRYVPFLVIPFTFLFLPKFTKQEYYKVIRLYGFSMAIFAIYTLIKAFINYSKTGNKDVFLHHQLVSVDLNAIYIAGFASLCLFYFILVKNKKPIDFIAIYILALFVFLLNSKTVFLINFILFIWYYIKKGNAQNSVKWMTITLGATFLFLSYVFVPQVQNRVDDEYETAFVDNTIYLTAEKEENNIYNISLKQAWNNTSFNSNQQFPGTAYRVFQARIFTEMLQEQNMLFTGFGVNASDTAIINKHQQYKLFKEYNYHNFHNQYIQFFSELGILGLLIFIVMLGVNLKNAISNNNFLHIVFAFTMIILFLTESILCRQIGILFFIPLYCIFNSIEPKLKDLKK